VSGGVLDAEGLEPGDLLRRDSVLPVDLLTSLVDSRKLHSYCRSTGALVNSRKLHSYCTSTGASGPSEVRPVGLKN
jgi:hypothetical protein